LQKEGHLLRGKTPAMSMWLFCLAKEGKGVATRLEGAKRNRLDYERE